MQTTTQKMDKVARTLNNHVGRGYLTGAYKSWELIDRYHDLKATMISEGLWDGWCKAHKLDPTHDAYDCFA